LRGWPLRRKLITWLVVASAIPFAAAAVAVEGAAPRDRLILAAIVVVLALGTGLALAAAILGPIKALSAATSAIAGGDLSARVPPGGDDELGRLLASFNAMAARLEHDDAALRGSRDELERRVEERTAALAEISRIEARARQALEVSTGRLEILARTAHELAAASGDAMLVLQLAARRLAELIGDGCSIRLLSDDGQWLEPTRVYYHPDPAARAFAAPRLGLLRQRVGEGVGGRVAASGEAQLISELTAEQVAALARTAPAARELIEALGVVSMLTLPLRSRERTIGVVNLVRGTAGRPYTIDDQRFAQEVADRAALAIDNAVLVATLERRVAARTAALEAANEELEAFSYSVSHDLRAPLRAIDGFSQVLLTEHAGQLDEEGQHYLHRVRSATQRMAGLIDDLLHLARITQRELHWAQVDLSALADQAVSELRRRDPARTTPIHVALGLTCRGDARLLAIVLDNLLGNAWKFTAGRPSAEIWVGSELRDGRVVFTVRDTGAGFDMRDADKLFLPFQRLHSAEEFEGVGVGLATVHRIITRHGGRIWADAVVGRGATFSFTLAEPA